MYFCGKNFVSPFFCRLILRNISDKAIQKHFYANTQDTKKVILFRGKSLYQRLNSIFFFQKGAVPDDHCLKEAPKPTSKDPCNVPCEGDCVMSQWGQWTKCSKSCGHKKQPGHITRQRSILLYPNDGKILLVW